MGKYSASFDSAVEPFDIPGNKSQTRYPFFGCVNHNHSCKDMEMTQCLAKVGGIEYTLIGLKT